jgi:hypothetical protein
MDISSVGSMAGSASLFDAASANLDDSSPSTPPSLSSDSGSGDETVAAAQYGFDGRVLAMQANAIAQLFSALA